MSQMARYLMITLLALYAFAADVQVMRLCLRTDPKTFDPLLVTEASGDTVRYLTGGVLIRINRQTQQPEAGVASSWKFSESGKRITFELRRDIRFSDGTPFSADDVAYTLRRMTDPELRSPLADAFRVSANKLVVTVVSPSKVSVLLPGPIAGVERLFDQVAIMSSRSPLKERAVLGPFVVSDYKPGKLLVLSRNQNYWRRDFRGRQLPYLERIHFDIQPNREIETLRFSRGEINMVTSLDPETFERLRAEVGDDAVDAGPTDESEFLWFNQVQRAPIPEYKRAWFRSRVFRKAISHAINRADMVRIVYRGHAAAASGPFSQANTMWFNSRITPDVFSPQQALALLTKDGFHLKDGRLYDQHGKSVEFSLLTNSGNKARARMASLIQQDLAKVGITVFLAPLEFGSLLDRITRSYSYEACLLGLVNVDPDPNGQMNVWLSSGASHQWNPSQPSPETPWEAEIDSLMRNQASSTDHKKRKASFDRVQEIISTEAPLIYLVTRNALVAVHSSLQNVIPLPSHPQLLWNADHIAVGNTRRGSTLQ